MAGTTHLNPEDRHFFSLVARVIFTNPFSVEQAEIEALVSPESMRTHKRHEHIFTALLPDLNERFARLEQRGLGTLHPFQGQDRELLENAFLFHTYHRFIKAIDGLIQTELHNPLNPAQVPFADRVLAVLTTRGFSRDSALRYLGLFYQLRRAYYFIARFLVGNSPSMKQLRFSLWNNVFTYDARTYDRYLWKRMEDFSVLLLGETGTGKGSAAAAIGRSGYIPFDPKSGRFSHSFNDTFTAINLSQFPESLIESELFGHRKGAFTGAVDNHKGVFERCLPGGTLFLDEIGDTSTAIQIKLLQVLQERTFVPVGSRQAMRFSGRVIAATNRPLPELRRQGQFRDDFFYRLCSDIITLPPLRQRIAESDTELPSLVQLLVQRISGRDNPDLTSMVLDILARSLTPNYPWPGNVRELAQAVRRILLTRHYQGELSTAAPEEQLLELMQTGSLTARELLGHYCALLYRRLGSYEAVARRLQLDRRTVKKHLQDHSA